MSEKPTFGNGEENQKTTTGIPHAGGENVPEDVRERPVVEYSTPLDEAYRQGLLNTDPEQPFEGFEAAAPQAGEKAGFDLKSAQLRDSHTEAPKKSKKGLIIGGVASLAVAGVAVFGVNALANKNETPTEPTNPDATAPVTPGETQAPTNAPTTPEVTPSPTDIPTTFEPTPSATEAPSTPTETEKGSEYTASELREMPLNDYLALSAAEREPLVKSMLSYALEWQEGDFGAHWDGDTSELYKYNPLEVASENNTAEEIAMQYLYLMQLALTQTEDMDSSRTFDPEMATKALAGGFTRESYISNGGDDSLVDGNDTATYWASSFRNLDTASPHEYTQEVIDAKFRNKSTITDNSTGEEHTIVTVEFATGELPETLVDGFKEGTATVNRFSFVWNEDVNRWMHYAGVPQNQQPGWKPSK